VPSQRGRPRQRQAAVAHGARIRSAAKVGEERIDAEPGMYLLVPRGTAHTFAAAEGGGRFLLLMVPGGLEHMFFELAELPPNSITDAAVRAAIAARYDSIPL
jgi:hypothetical protein